MAPCCTVFYMATSSTTTSAVLPSLGLHKVPTMALVVKGRLYRVRVRFFTNIFRIRGSLWCPVGADSTLALLFLVDSKSLQQEFHTPQLH